jgi:Trk-type K+ transport system membrane component
MAATSKSERRLFALLWLATSAIGVLVVLTVVQHTPSFTTFVLGIVAAYSVFGIGCGIVLARKAAERAAVQ